MIDDKKAIANVVNRSQKQKIARPNLKFNFKIKQRMMGDK